MTTLNIMDLRNELCHFLRYNDIFSTTIRGITRYTSSYNVGIGGESTHTFTGKIPVRDFTLLTVNSAAKYYLRDYTMNWDTGVLTWNSALVQGDAVAFTLDWGSTEKIYPDMPRDDLTFSSYPRVGIELTGISTVPIGLGGANHLSDIIVTILVWVPVNKDTNIAGGFGGMSDLENTMTLIRSAIRTNAKNFYSFPWIYPKGTAPITRGMNGKIMQHSQDFLVRFRLE